MESDGGVARQPWSCNAAARGPCAGHERARGVRGFLPGRVLDAARRIDAERTHLCNRPSDIVRAQPAGEHERALASEGHHQTPIEGMTCPAQRTPDERVHEQPLRRTGGPAPRRRADLPARPSWRQDLLACARLPGEPRGFRRRGAAPSPNPPARRRLSSPPEPGWQRHPRSPPDPAPPVRCQLAAPDTARGELGTKLRPMASAPASATISASWASSRRRS